MDKPPYFSIGELAQRAGVTVRTLQYYDQEGLLVPSAKGPNNQRLYTDQDAQDLYRILSLKYLGLPLAQIKSELSSFSDNRALHSLAARQMEQIEQDFQHLYKRLATMRHLLEVTNESTSKTVDWESLVKTIEESEEESQFFWNLTSIRENESAADSPNNHSMRNVMVAKWHELIADALRSLADSEPLNSRKNQDLARRYLALDESQQTLTVNQNFILMENIVPNKLMGGSFDALRESVCNHLEEIIASYKESREGFSE